MEHYGQVDASSTIYIYFTTHDQTGAAVAPLTAYEANDVQLYKDGSATQRSSTSGWTMTSPFDSIVGLHLLAIDLSDNTDAGFYAAGHRYTAVLSADTETVDGKSVVRVIADFTIGPVSSNMTQILGTAVATPNTAGLLDVNTKQAGGTAWGSGAITAASIASDAITNAKIAADAIGASEIADGAIDAATFAAGAINAAAIASDAITAAKIAPDAIGASELASDAVTEIQSGLATASALATVQADTDDIQTRLPAALVSGRMDASVGAMASGVVTATAIAADAIGASELAADAVAEIVTALLTTQMTESYAANGAAPTLAQMLFMLWSEEAQFEIIGTTISCKKLDGSTEVLTFTLDSSTAPTRRLRAT